FNEVARRIDHLREAAAVVLHQHVGQQQGEWLAADELARTPYRVAEPEGELLPREARRSGTREVAREQFEVVAPLALCERVLELELPVEMVLDNSLVAASHEDEMLDAGLARLVDHVLEQRAGGHRQHLLRHS